MVEHHLLVDLSDPSVRQAAVHLLVGESDLLIGHDPSQSLQHQLTFAVLRVSYTSPPRPPERTGNYSEDIVIEDIVTKTLQPSHLPSHCLYVPHHHDEKAEIS